MMNVIYLITILSTGVVFSIDDKEKFIKKRYTLWWKEFVLYLLFLSSLMFIEYRTVSESTYLIANSLNVENLLISIIFFVCIMYCIPNNKHTVKQIVIKCLKLLLIGSVFYIIIKSYIRGDFYTISLSKFKWVILVYSICSVVYIFPEKIRKKLSINRTLYKVVILTCPLLSFGVLELLCNGSGYQMSIYYAAINIFILYAFFFIIYYLLNKNIYSIVIYLLVMLIIGLAEHYIILFRGTPILPSDLYALDTAVQVAGGYEIRLNNIILYVIVLFLFVLMLTNLLSKIVQNKVQAKKNRIYGTILLIMTLIGCNSLDFSNMFKITLDYWNPTAGYYENGFVLSYLTYQQKMKMNSPDNYDKNNVNEILEQYVASDKKNITQEKPTVIAIMSETFSDLSVLGDIAYEPDVYENWYGIDDYLLRGNLYVSTFGGGTCNTEFEFLTGNSMANLPYGSIPYRQYNMNSIGNLATIFKSNGFTTTAIHPENPNNWGRTEVYNNFGFEEFLSIDDFDNIKYIRDHVSDESCYEMIIDKYEELTKPGFIFNVTMQNHGGYDLDSIKDIEKVNIDNKYAQYSDVITYLSLLKESDNVLLNLLDYFKSVEKPVIICIFGDHQASLDTNFIQDIHGKKLEDRTLEEIQQSYAVPYMIWTNQEIDESVEMDMSANYLGQLLLRLSGIDNVAYSNYLIDLMEKIEIINRFGYRVDGEWYSYDEVTSYTQYIDEYQQIQYSALFDKSREKRYYIPSVEE